MIRRIMSGLSALIFLMGSLALLGSAATAWAYVIVVAATQGHWTVGAAVFVASLWSAQRYEDTLRAPWDLWFALWLNLDHELERRTRDLR